MINTWEELYIVLKKYEEDYVFTGDIVSKLPILVQHCHTDKEKLFLFLGGPILWFTTWRANKKVYANNGLSKLEVKLIYLLNSYEVTIKNNYCTLIRKQSS